MKKIFFLTFFIFTIITPNFSVAKNYDVSAHQVKIEYISYNAETYNDVLTGKFTSAKKVTLHGDLYIPTKDGKYPVILLQHGSGTISETYGDWYNDLVPVLIKNGFGVFVNDSYHGRGMGNSSADQSKLSGTARVLDAFYALNELSKHPNVVPTKIGITGYSFGGFVSHMTANKNLIDALKLKNTFASHLPVYPTCQAYFKEINLTGKPMLFLLGEKDDWTPAKYCVEYVENLKKNGINANYKIYSGARHGFINTENKTYSDAWKLTECGSGYINKDGFYNWGGKEHKGEWSEMTTYLGKTCASKGVTLGGSKEDRQNTINDTLIFFKKTLL